MKDKKFIILLVFITIVALVNVIWLVTLQTKVNRRSSKEILISETKKLIEEMRYCAAELSRLQPGKVITHPLFIHDLTVRNLHVVNEDIEERILMTAKQDNAGIYFIEPNQKIRMCMETRGPGKDAVICIFLEAKEIIPKHKKRYPGIYLTSLGKLKTSTFLISGTQGQETTIVPFGLFSFDEHGQLTGTLK